MAAAPGVARGAWVHVRRRELPVGGRVAPDAVEAEEARLRAASNQAADDLMALSERVGAAGHDDEAAIFMAHAAMAWDPALVDTAAARIRDELEDGVAAIVAAGAQVAAMLAALDDEILSARAADVIDVADRIARLLAGLPVEESLLPSPAVVVAEDLSPSLTATLPREQHPRDRPRGGIPDGARGDPRPRLRDPGGRGREGDPGGARGRRPGRRAGAGRGDGRGADRARCGGGGGLRRPGGAVRRGALGRPGRGLAPVRDA